MKERLNGKVALITGASSGIGEATAFTLARAGAKVALVARRTARLEDLARKISDAGGTALPIQADVSDPDQVWPAVRKVAERLDQIDILVNNAGVMLLGPVLGADVTDWQRIINVNVLGLMYCTHAVLPFMVNERTGHIVNISSVSGRIASAGSAVYNASKWAVGAFSEALRQEVHKHGIRVTLIEPGAVLTELTDHITNPDAKERVKSWVATMTPLTSEDIARSILYAVSQPPHVNVNEILIRPTDQNP